MSKTKALIRSLLTVEEQQQIEAIRERMKSADFLPKGPAREVQFALQDALDGVLCLAHGSLGLAPNTLKEASDRAHKAAISL